MRSSVPSSGRVAERHYRMVSAEYFDVLGILVRRGRAFDDTDLRETMPVAIIGGGLARKYWRDGKPIGTQIQVGDRGCVSRAADSR